MISRHFQSDGNTKGIVKKWSDAGRVADYWQPVNRQKGQPDLVIPFAGITWLVEIKKPGEDLSDDQRKWHAKWLAAGGGPIAVIHSFEELCVAVGAELPF